MQITVLCATDRGYRALKCLRKMEPDADFLVVTFHETPHEPPYLETIRAFCEQMGCEFLVQRDVQSTPVRERITTGTDLLFCFGWRYWVPKSVYGKAKLGAYVVHDSLLPEYRGFSPAIWALINGEQVVGATLFEMSDQVDAGRIVGQQQIIVEPHDNIGTIREKGTLAYLSLLESHFTSLTNGSVTLTEQDHSRATYTCKWTPEDARIDWRDENLRIHNLVRATTAPYPGAFCYRGNDKVTIWKATLPPQPRIYASKIPGAICSIYSDGTVGVLTGSGELILQEISVNDGPRVRPAFHLKTLTERLQ